MRLAVLLLALLLAISCKKDERNFGDLERKDWYEDLKHQEELKNQSDFAISFIEQMQKPAGHWSAEFYEMFEKERTAHLELHRKLLPITEKILAAKTYKEYRKLK